MPTRSHVITRSLAGVSRGSKRCATFVFPGPAYVGYRTANWVMPANAGTIGGWRASAFEAAVGGDMVIDVFDKDNNSIFASSKVVIPDGSTAIESDTNIDGPLVVVPGVDRFYAEIIAIDSAAEPGSGLCVVLFYS